MKGRERRVGRKERERSVTHLKLILQVKKNDRHVYYVKTCLSTTLTCSYDLIKALPSLDYRVTNNNVLPPKNNFIMVHISRSSYESILIVLLQKRVIKYKYSCVVEREREIYFAVVF